MTLYFTTMPRQSPPSRDPLWDLQRFYFFPVLEPMRIRGTEPSPAQQPWPWLLVCLSGYVYTDEYKFPFTFGCLHFIFGSPSQHLPTPPKRKKKKKATFSAHPPTLNSRPPCHGPVESETLPGLFLSNSISAGSGGTPMLVRRSRDSYFSEEIQALAL